MEYYENNAVTGRMLKAIAKFSSKETDRYLITGVAFKDGVFFATDAYSLIEYRMNSLSWEGSDAWFPPNAFKHLKAGDVFHSIEELKAACEHVTPGADGTYDGYAVPGYKFLLEGDFEKGLPFMVNASYMKRICETAEVFSFGKDRTPRVLFYSSGNGVIKCNINDDHKYGLTVVLMAMRSDGGKL